MAEQNTGPGKTQVAKEKAFNHPLKFEKAPLIAVSIAAVVVLAGISYSGVRSQQQAVIAEEANATAQARIDETAAKIDGVYHDAMGNYHRAEAANSDSISETVYHQAQAIKEEAAAAWDKTKGEYHEAVGDYRQGEMEEAISATVAP